jgi:hypothetical protein
MLISLVTTCIVLAYPSPLTPWSAGDFMDLGGVELSFSMAHTG